VSLEVVLNRAGECAIDESISWCKWKLDRFKRLVCRQKLDWRKYLTKWLEVCCKTSNVKY